MSKKTKKSNAPSELFVPTVEELPGTDPSILPFQQWSDQELNAEHWDVPKRSQVKSTPNTLHVIFFLTSLIQQSIPGKPEHYFFEDDQLIIIPIRVYRWKRPFQVFPGAKLSVYKETGRYSDLISASRHLLHFECMRKFIDMIKILEHLGYNKPWKMEGVTSSFIPTTNNNPWKPWHHVYSLNKAGKGQIHNPQINKIGKYIIRLYWMGYWRKVIVDDLLPVDRAGNILLPMTELETDEEFTMPFAPKEVELWPFLVIKAICKVGALSWNESRNVMNYSIANCFTGWSFAKLYSVENLTTKDSWHIVNRYTEKYVWPEEEAVEIVETAQNKTSKKEHKLETDNETSYPFVLLSKLKDLREYPNDYIPELTPCWDPYFYFVLVKEMSRSRYENLPTLPRWKKFRWLDWAIKKGIWPESYSAQIRKVKVLFGTPKMPSPLALDIRSLSERKSDIHHKLEANVNQDKYASKEVKSEKRKQKKKTDSNKRKKSSKGSKKTKSSKGSRKSKSKRISSKKTGKSIKTVKYPPPPDPAIWMDFKVLEKHIDIFCVFFKPSAFPYRIRVSNLESIQHKQQGTKSKSKSTEENISTESFIYIKYSNQLKKSRNEPLYFFCDTLETKFLHVNLIQSGCVELLKKVTVENIEEECNIESEYLCNIRTCPAYAYLAEDDLATLQKIPAKTPITQYNFISYKWQVNTFGDKIFGDTTSGRSGVIHEFGSGRLVCQIFIKSKESYMLDLMTDSPLVVGSLELINEHMAKESEVFTELCYNVASSFGKLIQKFGTEKYMDGMRHLFSWLKPDTAVTKKESKNIQKAFLLELLDMIQSIYPVDKWYSILRALQVLFLDPTLKLNMDMRRRSSFVPKVLDICICEVDSLDEIRLRKQKERAAVTIQAVFRRFFVRKLLRSHKQEAEDHFQIFENLKDVYNSIFSVQNRLTKCSTLLRRLILKSFKMQKLRTRYVFYEDLENVINLKSFTGRIQTYINSWVFIARYKFECDSRDPIIVKICLFCDLPRYVVRVFDNDTEKEIERYTHTVSVWAYKPNLKGYTVLCYGWSEVQKNIAWKLSFVTKKIDNDSLIDIFDNAILPHHVTDIYIPSVHGRIFRCIVKIQKNSLMTFRLSLSFQEVKVLFKCTREDGKKCAEIRGQGSLILPIVNLEYFNSQSQTYTNPYSDKSKSILRAQSSCRLLSKMLSFFEKGSKISVNKSLSSTSEKFNDTYILEAYVLEDSWPLTKKEWDTVESYKQNKLYASVVPEEKSVPNLSRASTMISETSSNEKCVYFGNLTKPYWTLQSICDKNDTVIVTKDASRENEILNIKKSWYEEDAERYEKSKLLRETFLEQNYACPHISDADKIHIRASTAALVTADELNLIPTRILRNEVQLIEDITETPLMQTINHKIVFVGDDKAPKFNKKPPNVYKLLPTLDLAKYYKPAKIPYNEDNTILFTDELMEQLQADREAHLREYEDMLGRYFNDIIGVIIDQDEHIVLMYNWYTECREESARLLTEAYANREKYMENFMQAQKTKNASESKSRKNEKKKKKQK